MSYTQDIEISSSIHESINNESEITAKHIPPFKFALVIDEEIVDILYAEERVANLCLSNAIVVDVTEKIEELESLGLSLIDATYDFETENFILEKQY